MRDWSEHPPVIGIDTNSHGFHAVSSVPISMPSTEPLALLTTEGWTISRSKDYLDRLRLAHATARAWFAALPAGSSLWVEEALVLPKNPETTRKLVMMAGALYGAFMSARPDATWFFVNVSTWRKDVLGDEARPVGWKANKEGWKALARQYVQARWPQEPENATYEEKLEFGHQMAVLRDMWDEQPDLYDAACLMEYGRQQISSGKVRL
jgi:hypothetical protein